MWPPSSGAVKIGGRPPVLRGTPPGWFWEGFSWRPFMEVFGKQMSIAGRILEEIFAMGLDVRAEP
jgi:hypothetical protein